MKFEDIKMKYFFRPEDKKTRKLEDIIKRRHRNRNMQTV